MMEECCIGFLLGIIFSLMVIYLFYYLYSEEEFKIGDMVYLKPTGEKYIIYDKSCDEGRYYLADMNCNLISAVPYHQNLFDKWPSGVQ